MNARSALGSRYAEKATHLPSAEKLGALWLHSPLVICRGVPPSAGMTKIFGQDQSKMFALSLNAAHTGEHYGNIVTYMRMKGMVPPSSQPRR